MALASVATGDTVAAADVNQFKNALEGAATATFLLNAAATTHFQVKLADAAGSYTFKVLDSAGSAVATIDSDGNLTLAGGFTPGTLTLPAASSPSQTAEGQVVWDSDDDVLTIGDGASRKTFYSGRGLELVGSNTTDQATTSTSEVSLVTVTLTRSVQPTEWLLIQFQTMKGATAGATTASVGLRLNAANVVNVFDWTSGGTTSESAHFTVIVPAYVAAYAGVTTPYAAYPMVARAKTSGIDLAIGNAGRPSAAITSVIIRALVSSATLTQSVQEVRVYAMGAS